jgi:hypothetical protein
MLNSADASRRLGLSRTVRGILRWHVSRARRPSPKFSHIAQLPSLRIVAKMCMTLPTMQSSPSHRVTPTGQRRRARRRSHFILPSGDSELSQRRRQNERVKLKRSLIWSAWRWLLGIAASCEFLSYLYSKTCVVVEEVVPQPQKRWGFFRRKETVEEPTIESVVSSFVSPWMTALYILYFLDSFFHAYEMRNRAFRMNEKERLLRGRKTPVYSNPSIVFVITLLLFWSFLPTWFWWQLSSFLQITTIYTYPELVKQSIIKNPQYSLGYAVFVHCLKRLTANVKGELKAQLKMQLKSLSRQIMRFAVTHPRKFKRRYRTASTTFIWIKYLKPITRHLRMSDVVGATRDLLKAWKQDARKRYQHIRRRSMWAKLDSQVQRDVAALLIQRTYRAYCSRKWMRLVRLEEEKREAQMILLVQEAIKKRAQEELEEQERALEELEALQQRERKRRRSSMLRVSFNPQFSIMGQDQRTHDEQELRRKYQLQEDIQNRIKSERARLMLLRPDSRFAFHCLWIYVACAILETVHLMMLPRLIDDGSEEEERTKDSLRFIFHHSQSLVHVVLCFGVLIWSFVGAIDPVTGRLMQRPWFERWIYPGLLFNVMMNPALSEMKAVVKFIAKAGPGRVWRWWLLFLFPISRRVVSWLEWKIWIRLVQRENQRLVTVRQRGSYKKNRLDT